MLHLWFATVAKYTFSGGQVHIDERAYASTVRKAGKFTLSCVLLILQPDTRVQPSEYNKEKSNEHSKSRNE